MRKRVEKVDVLGWNKSLFRRDYAERVVASFANQIQSEYYDGNRSVSIEGI